MTTVYNQNFEAVLITVDSYHDLDTLWELTCHHAELIYNIIIDHTRILFVSENAVIKIVQPGAVTSVAGALTFATAKSNNSSI